MLLRLLGMRQPAARGVRRITREESATDQLPERDWLFPVILATLLVGSAVSFALAYAGGHIVQHQELKISSEHATPRGAEPMVLRVHGPSGE
jgi:hypothetical protein